MKYIRHLLLVFIVAMSSNVFAVTPEQMYMSREPQRQAYQVAIDRNFASIASKVNSSVVNGNVTSTVNVSKTIADGSKISTSSTVSKAASAAVAAKGLAGRLALATAGGFVGSLAVDALFKAVNWVMDPANNRVVYNESLIYSSVCYNSPSLNQCYSNMTELQACKASASYRYLVSTTTITSGTYSSSNICTDGSSGARMFVGTATNTGTVYVPYGDPAIAEKIRAYLAANPNTTITNNIYNAAYNYDPKYDDYKSPAAVIGEDALTGIDGAVATGTSDINKTDRDGSPTNVKTSFGNDPTVGTTSNTTTTTNPDGTTTTSTGSGSSQLPAFCGWASIVCDWIGWTKDDSGLPTKDTTDLNITVPFEQKNKSVSWGASCPVATYTPVSLHGVSAQVKTSDFSFICGLDWLIKPMVLALASLSSVFILFGFHRNTEE